MARIESRSGSPAWIPAISGSPSRSTASRPKRRRTRDAIDSSAVAGPRGSSRSRPMRSFPGQEKRRLRKKGPSRVGTASIMPSGSGCRRPRRSTKIVRVSGLVGMSRSPRPSGATEGEAFRLLGQDRVGAGLDDETVHGVGADDAAVARRRLPGGARRGRPRAARARRPARRCRRPRRRPRRAWRSRPEPYEVGQGADERRRGVEGLRARELDAEPPARPARPARRCRTGSRCGRTRSRRARSRTRRAPSGAAVASASSTDGPSHGSGVRPALW